MSSPELPYIDQLSPMRPMKAAPRGHRLIAAALVCHWCFGISQARAPAAAPEDFSCAARRETSADVVTVRTTLGGVPALLRLPMRIAKPPIILWHGLSSPASEAELMQALPLDDVPSVKVYLGLPLFGVRAPSDGAESLARRQAEDYAARIFEPVVVGAATELRAILQALKQDRCLEPNDEIGLFGFSAGGTAVLMALAESGVRVRAAVTVNAPIGLKEAIDAMERATRRPYEWTESARLLAERSDAVQHAAKIVSGSPPALLLFQGADDTVIVPSGALSLRDALQPYYHRAGYDRRLKLVIASDVSHGWTEAPSLNRVRVTAADWFNRYL